MTAAFQGHSDGLLHAGVLFVNWWDRMKTVGKIPSSWTRGPALRGKEEITPLSSYL